MNKASSKKHERGTHVKKSRKGTTEAVVSSGPGTDGRKPVRMLDDLRAGTNMLKEELGAARNELRSLQERYINMYDNAPVGCVTLDKDGVIREANITAARLLGLPRGGIVGKPFNDYIVQESLETFRSHLSGVFGSNARRSCELEIESKTAGGAYVLLNSVRLPGGKDGSACYTIMADVTEKIRTQETSRENEGRLRRIMDSITDYVYTVRVENGRAAFTTHGEGCRFITGYTSGELRGDPHLWIRMVHEDDRDAVIEKSQQILNGAASVEMEHRIIHKDGTLRWVRNTQVPHYDPEGRLVSFDGLIRDITERRSAEEALQESEASFRALFTNMSEGVCLHRLIRDENGAPVNYVIQDVNPQYEMILGLTGEEVKGRLATAAYNTPEPPYLAEYSAVTASGRPISFETYFPPMGKFFHISVYKIGKDRFATVFFDITERKQTEEALRESETKLRAMFESSRDAISVSKKGIQVFANSAFLKLHGFDSMDEIIGASVVDYIAPSHKQQIMENIKRRAEGDDVPTFYETRAVKTDGTEFDEELNISAYELNGEIYSVVVIRDVTERKQAEEKLRESEEKFRNLFNNAEIGMFRTRLDGSEMLDLNDKFLAMLGTTREEMVGRPSVIFWADPKERDEMVGTLTVRGRVNNFECRLIRKDNTIISCITSLILYRDKGILEGSIIDITERKQVEKALQESEKRYRELADFMPEIIFESDTKGNLTYVNRIAYTMSGYSPEDLEGGLKILDTVAPEDRDRCRSNIELILAGGRSSGNEYTMLRRDGTTFPAMIHSRGIKPEGTITGIRGIVVDISERKKSELALKRSEEKFSRAFHNVLIPMAISRVSDGVFIDVNDEFCRIYEFPSDRVLGASAYDLGLWIDPEERRGHISKIRESGMIENNRVTFRTGTGRVLKAIFSGVGLTVGDEPCFLGWAVDITEFESITEALKLSEERFRSLFEDSADAQLLLDGTRIIECNSEAVKMMGCGDKSCMVGGLIPDFSPEIQPDGESSAAKGEMYAKMALGRKRLKYEWQLRRLDGSLFYAEVMLTAIPMIGGRILHANIRDITDRKRLQNEIINIIDIEQKRLGQNLHDGLGQELTGISFLCNSLSKRLKDTGLPESARSEEITAQVYRIITLVRNLSRELYPPNLVENEIAYTLSDFALNTGQMFGISCTYEYDPTLVVTDIFVSTQIYYVVREAVNNSIKHGRAKRIIIRLTSDGDRVYLVVEDDGVGLPDDAQPSEGLGLRIMAYRMDSINGTFYISRKKEGGTVVSCSFPLYRARTGG
jgi:PAS domain S-box-containing protein